MKSKQVKKFKLQAKLIDRCLSANLSPPEQAVVKELKYASCPELFLAGLQPLQSLFSLHSGKTNIVKINFEIANNKYSANSMWISIP